MPTHKKIFLIIKDLPSAPAILLMDTDLLAPFDPDHLGFPDQPAVFVFRGRHSSGHREFQEIEMGWLG